MTRILPLGILRLVQRAYLARIPLVLMKNERYCPVLPTKLNYKHVSRLLLAVG